MSRLFNTFKNMQHIYTIKKVYAFGLTVCPVVGYGGGMVLNYNAEAGKDDRVLDKLQVAVMGGFMGFAGGMIVGFLWPVACLPAALVGVDYVYTKLTNKKTSDNDN